MEFWKRTDVVVLLEDESDVVLGEVVGTKCYLQYPPMDVNASTIQLENNRPYLHLEDLLQVVETILPDMAIAPLFDQDGEWTHIRLEPKA